MRSFAITIVTVHRAVTTLDGGKPSLQRCGGVVSLGTGKKGIPPNTKWLGGGVWLIQGRRPAHTLLTEVTL